jgi:hypothetical protein
MNDTTAHVQEIEGAWEARVQPCPIDGGPITKFMFVPSEERASDSFTRYVNPTAPNQLVGRTVSDHFISRRQQIRHAIAMVVSGGNWPDRDRPARIPDGDVFISNLAAREAGRRLWEAGRTHLKAESGHREPIEEALRSVGEEYLRGLVEKLLEVAIMVAEDDLGERTLLMPLRHLDGDHGAPEVVFWHEPGWAEAPNPHWRLDLVLVYSVLDGIIIR